jgi:hypothetical protein
MTPTYEEVTGMKRGVYGISRLTCFGLLSAAIFLLTACSRSSSPAPLKTIDTPQGGKIVYGVVDGADSQAAAMASILRSVSNSCGERPRVGKVFRVRGSHSDAVFFTVVNHPAGDRRVAGMIIASQTDPSRVEAAMVSDEASRFGSTVNVMLQQLFGVWRPGERSTAGATVSNSAPEANAGPATRMPSMHRVVLADNTASVDIPPGWSVDPRAGGGGMFVFGPRGERVHINMWVGADDPYGPGIMRMRQMHIMPNPQRVLFPVNSDLARGYPEIFQRIRATNGMRPADLRIARAESVQAARGMRCIMAFGQMDPDGNGMRDWIDMLCATPPNQYGSYNFQSSGGLLPLGSSDQDRATVFAIINSFQINMPLVKQRADAQAAPHLAAMRRNYESQQQQLLARNQQIVNNIKQIGANATARYNATQAANEAQHRAWREGQNVNSANVQNFSNYLLDQSVVRDNYGNTHSTEWNQTADTLVRANPNRYEIVNNPNYWQGHRF